MIEELLKILYPAHHGLASDNVRVDYKLKSGIVELSDAKACDECLQRRPERNGCNKINLIINTSATQIGVVAFEAYIKQFDNTVAEVKDKCDYIFVDGTAGHRKIAFCDLTCSKEKYVEPNDGLYKLGKRAKATSQMEKSMECLMQDPLLKVFIVTFPEKVCLFGWRDYDVPENTTPKRGNALRNMQAFIKTPSSKSRTLSTQVKVLDHGFNFVQVKYPTVYQW